MANPFRPNDRTSRKPRAWESLCLTRGFEKTRHCFLTLPEYGVPVVLNVYSGETYTGVVSELEGLYPSSKAS
jgi:hypothetical protein